MGRISNHSSEETRQAIQSAFIELYRNNRLDKITIGALCTLSGVNRSTFYYYYKDIYDLLEQLEKECIAKMKTTLPHVISGIRDHSLTSHLAVLTEFIQVNNKLLYLFLVEKPNNSVLTEIKDYAKSYVFQIYGRDTEHLTKEEQAIVEYTANAQIGLIRWWLTDHHNISMKELLTMIEKISTMGPVTLLQEM